MPTARSGSDDLDALGVADALWLAARIVACEPQTPPRHETRAPDPPPSAGAAVKLVPSSAKLVAGDPTQRAAETVDAGKASEPLRIARGREPERGGGPVAYLEAPPSLADPAAFRRALRAFRADHAADDGTIDETATVERCAQQGGGYVSPVAARGSRRRFKLSLIVEAGDINGLWNQPLEELERLLHAQGIFRQVRRWSLDSSGATATLTPVDRRGTLHERRVAARGVTWWADEILIVASHCVSKSWWNGSYPELLKTWASAHLVVLMNLLDPRLWERSWSGAADAMLYAERAAACTAAMSVTASDDDTLHGLLPLRPAIPIVALEPQSLARWARVAMRPGTGRCEGLLLAARAPLPQLADDAPAAAMSATHLVQRYRLASSPTALALAQCYSVAAPLNFPVMRWVQKALLPEADESHLAEFMLGGLLECVVRHDNPDANVYEFVPGVRPLLQHGMSKNYAVEVLEHVGAYLEHRAGPGTDLRMTVTRHLSDDAIDALPGDLRAFALMSRRFAERLFGSFKPLSAPTPVPNGRDAPTPDSDEAPIVVRRLSGRIIDLHWSPTAPDQLAILHEDGIELWNANGTGYLLAFDGPPERQSRPPVLTVYWSAPDDADGLYKELAERVVERLSDAWRIGGWQPVRVVNIDGDGAVDEPDDVAVLVVFDPLPEDARASAGVRRRDAKVGRLLDFTDKIVSVSIGFGGSIPAWKCTQRIELRTTDPESVDLSRQHALTLGYAASRVKIDIEAHSPSRYFVPASPHTAIGWLPDGRLAAAGGKQGQRQIQIFQRTSTSAHSIVETQSQEALPLIHVIVQIAGVRTTDGTPQVTYVDDRGDSGVSVFSTRNSAWRLGNGLPRPLVRTDQENAWAISGQTLGIVLESNQRTLSLPPAPETRLSRRLRFHCDEYLLTAWMASGLTSAVTSYGRLFSRIGPDEFRLDVVDAPSPTNSMPFQLVGDVVAAAPAFRKDAVGIVQADGTIRLWDTRRQCTLVEWSIPGVRQSSSAPRIAVSDDGAHIAVAWDNQFTILAARATNAPRRSVLWVDRYPEHNYRERGEMERFGIAITPSLSTRDALEKLESQRFGMVISDMGRKDGSNEGYFLLDTMRARRDATPLVFYSMPSDAEHVRRILAHGGQGCTNDPRELVRLVIQILDIRPNAMLLDDLISKPGTLSDLELPPLDG